MGGLGRLAFCLFRCVWFPYPDYGLAWVVSEFPFAFFVWGVWDSVVGGAFDVGAPPVFDSVL